jgi:hypothetical protein
METHGLDLDTMYFQVQDIGFYTIQVRLYGLQPGKEEIQLQHQPTQKQPGLAKDPFFHRPFL